MLSFVVLTMGNRPVELEASLRSALDQEDVDVEIVLVGNGVPPEWTAPIADDRIRTFPLPENLGVPAGRNYGVREAKGDVIVFLDDDGYYPSLGLGLRLQKMFDVDPSLGIVSFQVRDPDGGPAQRRHVPRLIVGDPDRSSQVTTFLGGASAVRKAAFEAGGGLPENFFFAHEETDLAWQAINAGYRIVYDAECVMCHPATPPTRHEGFYRYNARNRVWLAKRNLPWPIAIGYLGVWIGMTVVRERRPAALKPWFKGFAEGCRTDAGPRRPISWRTAWRMTRAGRPPII
ncbi:glycosyltransferase family 2 protein [Actinocorallia sp. A-T 12471]|uniref:glycosyltransferase family 2 protein n=1 Tax=Actinocorallia sp. A-T 12471 TaxID=3089813 RepID=UPI0029CB9DB9|nr:glycosyltransferase family 2 protein [Actinocorallia sp. A-T 12471]MDX6745107.1 glycosyltransferase family 2 protein [Actinocorallia sp. A-T 12471]